jgi:hypothetical protein
MKLQKIEMIEDYQMDEHLRFFQKILYKSRYISKIMLEFMDAGAGAVPEIYSMDDRKAIGEPMGILDASTLYHYSAIQALRSSVVDFMKLSKRVEKQWKMCFEILREDGTKVFVGFFWDGCDQVLVGEDSFDRSPEPAAVVEPVKPSTDAAATPIISTPLKRLPEVTPYAEVVKKCKRAPVVAKSYTFMSKEKTIYANIAALQTLLEDNQVLISSIERFNDIKVGTSGRLFSMQFSKENADASFYFLWTVTHVGYPASYRFTLDEKIYVEVAIGEAREAALKSNTSFNPGFTEESEQGMAHCNGTPVPPLIRVPSDTLSLFFPSGMDELIFHKHLSYIRDFICNRC